MQRTVVVVDDHASFGNVLGQMLSVLGHRVEVFTSPADCLDWLGSESPDLAFLDLRMPEIDGIDLLQRIRAAGHDFPVVAITGYPESDAVDTFRQLGGAAIATKPISIDLLQGLVALTARPVAAA